MSLMETGVWRLRNTHCKTLLRVVARVMSRLSARVEHVEVRLFHDEKFLALKSNSLQPRVFNLD